MTRGLLTAPPRTKRYESFPTRPQYYDFPTQLEALTYLVAFGVGTIAAMAAFSWLMGSVAARFPGGGTRIYRGLMTTCAVTAIVVGCFWLFQ